MTCIVILKSFINLNIMYEYWKILCFIVKYILKIPLSSTELWLEMNWNSASTQIQELTWNSRVFFFYSALNFVPHWHTFIYCTVHTLTHSCPSMPEPPCWSSASHVASRPSCSLGLNATTIILVVNWTINHCECICASAAAHECVCVSELTEILCVCVYSRGVRPSTLLDRVFH